MELLPHQRTGVDWLASHARGGLFDDMGLGKTVQAAVAADRVGAKRLLVVAPASLCHNWQREVSKWTRRRRVQVIRSGRDRVEAGVPAVVVSHSLLRSPAVQDQLLDYRAEAAIVDEAHAFRSPTAQQTRALYGVPGRVDQPGVLSVSPTKWVLTGTPAPNGAPSEMWTMLAHLAPERIGHEGRPMTWWEWRDRFCELGPSSYTEDGFRVVGIRKEMRGELHKRLDGFSLRRLKSEVLKDLPPLRWGHVTLDDTDVDVAGALRKSDLPPHYVDKLIAAWRSDDDSRLEELTKAAEHFARFRRICGVLKAGAVGDYLAEELRAEPAKKIVVFVHHIEVGAEVRSKLDKFGAVALHGGVPAAKRQGIVDAFQTDPRVRVIVCQLVAGGVGITLTAAHDVVFCEQSWIPGENLQAADRCHRIGQTQAVLARVFSLADSIDEFISESIHRKTAMLHDLLQ